MLAQRGVDAEAAAHDNLKTTYRRFMTETNPEQKDEAGQDLIRTSVWKDAIAEGPTI